MLRSGARFIYIFVVVLCLLLLLLLLLFVSWFHFRPDPFLSSRTKAGRSKVMDTVNKIYDLFVKFLWIAGVVIVCDLIDRPGS